tara:strand:+ start:833 stop:1537 length:705 start_codon:yes stop_codon:yes gene_type:complete
MISKNKLNQFENKIGYKFKNKSLLNQSLTHPSFYSELKIDNKKVNQFERLEFLGDRVLGLSIASMLFKKYKFFNEGDLSKKHSYLVQKNFLYKIAINLEIENLVLYNFKKKNKKMMISIISDTVESLIGAIYIDGGHKSSFEFIKKFWISYLDIDVSKTLDPKTALQEFSQQKEKKLPEYKIIKKEGPSHSPIFTVSLKVLNFKKINSTGSSIREAEKKAASEALKLIYEKKNT